MVLFYKDLRAPERHKKAKRAAPVTGSFWDRVWNLNCEEALYRLSGTHYVSGETYSFKNNSNGSRNILVNGKGTSCWVDQEGRIGSLDDGGPTIAQWLHWFHKDYRKVAEMIKEVFPECLDNKQPEQMSLI
jgi:hypothetical protein